MQSAITQIEIRCVETPQDQQAFIDLPRLIYQNDRNWVPALDSTVAEIFDSNHPFFEYGEMECFLAFRHNQLVGRVASVINRRLIALEGKKVGLFGFFECFEDLTVAQALLEAVQQWLRDRGIEVVRGPIDLSTDQRCLFLIDGFDSPPMFNTAYNPPYYPKFLEQLGWYKAKDAVAYILDVNSAPSKALSRGYEIAKKSGLTFRHINIASEYFESECRQIYHLSKISYSNRNGSWNYNPSTEAEFLRNAQQLRSLIDPNCIWIAEDPTKDKEMVGAIIGIPDYNLVLRHLNGRLNWCSQLKFLWYRRMIDQGRVILIASRPDYRHKMVPLALIYLILTNHSQSYKKYRRAELSWVWEDNLPSRKLIEISGGKVYKTYRLYEKAL
ncbi:hypothetical protein HJG54_29885 [Leptolyngbya sp. NK1-12]|uniref:N-acetyltransferase domain-containing protein n=1 Tax=Leptolyngbya sp. NK1-12 TaxID=2547451 RepID=A0AA96WL38_9CYAN|nr:hypothetical protein [Leptolyngbya sp. NK1-12]WNZ27124.1 hypothetical protein HJG54_29885 [Leptolyngbya sp. NK1-12]